MIQLLDVIKNYHLNLENTMGKTLRNKSKQDKKKLKGKRNERRKREISKTKLGKHVLI